MTTKTKRLTAEERAEFPHTKTLLARVRCLQRAVSALEFIAQDLVRVGLPLIEEREPAYAACLKKEAERALDKAKLAHEAIDGEDDEY